MKGGEGIIGIGLRNYEEGLVEVTMKQCNGTREQKTRAIESEV